MKLIEHLSVIYLFLKDQVCGKFVKTLNDQIVLCDKDEINALTEDGSIVLMKTLLGIIVH